MANKIRNLKMRILTIIVISMFLVSCAPPKTGRAGPAASKEPVVVAPPAAPKPCDPTKERCPSPREPVAPPKVLTEPAAGTSEEPVAPPAAPKCDATKELCDRYGRKVEAPRDAPKVLTALTAPEASASATPSVPPCDPVECSKKNGLYDLGGRPKLVKIDDCKDEVQIPMEQRYYGCINGECVVKSKETKWVTREIIEKDNIKIGIPIFQDIPIVGGLFFWKECCDGELKSMDDDKNCGKCGKRCEKERGKPACVLLKGIGMVKTEDYDCVPCDDTENLHENGNVIGNDDCPPLLDENGNPKKDEKGNIIITICEDDKCQDYSRDYTRRDETQETVDDITSWCIRNGINVGVAGFAGCLSAWMRNKGGGTTTPGGTTPTPSEPQKPAPLEQTPQP